MNWLPSMRHQSIRQFTRTARFKPCKCDTRQFITPASRGHAGMSTSPLNMAVARPFVMRPKQNSFSRPSGFGVATAMGLGLSFGVATTLLGPVALLEREYTIMIRNRQCN